MQAIETVYNGYRCRSRLEARWMVFFEAAGIDYQYEPEGYRFGEIYYLPDFFIPSWDSFVEIKGQEPTEEEKEKAGLLAVTTLKDVLIFTGECGKQAPIGDNKIHQFIPWRTDGLAGIEGMFSHNTQEFIVECELHHHVGLFLEHGCKSEGGHRYCPRGPILDRAYTAARQARFEHGEKPFIRKLISGNR